MFILYANKTNLTVRKREAMTSGSVNVYQVQFEFSEDWEGLTKTAVFETRGRSRAVLLDDTGLCTIPREVLAVPKTALRVGVYGAWGDMVLPTVWAHLGAILEGAAPAGGLCPSAPELWEQALAGKGDGLALDGQTLKLLSGEETLSQVELPASGGGPGSEEPPGADGGGTVLAFSEEEHIIGIWFGKPLYSRVVRATSPKASHLNQNIYLDTPWVKEVETSVTCTGFIKAATWDGDLKFPFAATSPGSSHIEYALVEMDKTNGLFTRMQWSDASIPMYCDQPMTVICTYTKKAD